MFSKREHFIRQQTETYFAVVVVVVKTTKIAGGIFETYLHTKIAFCIHSPVFINKQKCSHVCNSLAFLF
jgi:hypothetical protein